MSDTSTDSDCSNAGSERKEDSQHSAELEPGESDEPGRSARNTETSGTMVSDSPADPATELAVARSTKCGDLPFPVVGIGASAGGLDAFKNFFQAMPPTSGMAFVLVQHLDPTHESMMTDLLTKYTAMRVVQIEDDMPLTPNTVFMIPPNKYLSIKAGLLHLAEPVVRRGMRMPIDFLFRSMADQLQDRAICIVLSGTGADGALGLRAVKGEGGTAFAQDPATAQYDGMPQSAIATGVVDFVLPVEEMPNVLLSYVRHSHGWHLDDQRTVAKVKPDDLQSILAVLLARTNHDFRCYKKGTLTRRIHRRMGLRQVDEYAAYLRLLREDASEVKALLRDLLIGVTSFFRDPDAWKDIEELVVAKILAKKSMNDHLRVWVPGCCSGEEAYSLAMLILELQNQMGTSCIVQMFASDIDETALETARNGVYPESIAADVPAERLRRFFDYEDGRYRVNKQVRDMVVFANQNLVRDAPFSKLDLISCRNLLIYLDSPIQERVIALLHFSLNEGGYLFLGPSESTSQQDHLFEVVSKKWRIYRRIGVNQSRALAFPLMGGDEVPAARAGRRMSRDARPGSVTALAQQVLLQQYAPAAAVVNRRGEALYYHGPVSRYLEIVPGEPTRDIAELARDGLRVKVRSALQRSIRENEVTCLTGRIRGDTNGPAITITVRPLDANPAVEGLLLIAFEELSEPEPVAAHMPTEQIPEEVRQLEYELTATREDLQSTIEELETSNEELKASNEEAMSMNEELQSSNEELETSKEELQSLNEELTTVNNQLQDKVQELEATNNDVANLLNSTNVATLFLDRQLQVRRFTPAATRLFRLIPNDVGRHLEDIALRFQDSDLLGQARDVLATLQPAEKSVIAEDGSSFLCRILPYRTLDDRIDGVVLTFVDITELRTSETALRNSEQRLQLALEAVSDGLWDWDLRSGMVFRSPRYYELVRRRPEEDARDFAFFKSTVDPQDLPRVLAKIEAHKRGDTRAIDFCYRLVPHASGLRWMRARGRAVERDANGVATRIVGTLSDVTEQKAAEDTLRDSERRMQLAESLAQLGSWDLDLVSKKLRCSDEIYRILEVDPRQFGASFDALLQCVHPADRDAVSEAFAGSLRSEQDGFEIEHRIVRRKSGEVRIVQDKCTHHRDADGRVTRSYGMLFDITDRKMAEEQLVKLSQAVEQSPESIMITDSQARLEYVNEAVVRNTGYSREELIGQTPRMLQSGKTSPETYASLWHALTQGGSWRGELYDKRKDGTEHVELAMISPIRQANGGISHYLAVMEDITEKKRLSAELERHREHLQELVKAKTIELERAKEAAETANIAKNAFLANMSHELRTPLHGIMGLTQLVLPQVTEPAVREQLAKAVRLSQHLASLIDDVLDIAQIEAGRVSLTCEDIHFADVLGNIGDVLGKSATDKGLDLKIDLDPKLATIALRGEAKRLIQIILNLTSNAIKCTDAGVVTVRARLVTDNPSDVFVRVEVQDTGIGISEQEQQHLFVAFHQSDGSRTHKYSGTGLGLALSKRLAEAMGGSIGVTSQPGTGSTFWFTARFAKGTGDFVQLPAASEPYAEAILHRDYADRKLLVVDDDEDNRQLTLLQLKPVWPIIDSARDGLEALDLAQKNHYDLILMDVRMPRMDGLEATRRIRQLPGFADVPILAMTANIFPEDMAAYTDAGMDDCIAKAVDPTPPFEPILKWLSRS